VDYVEELVRVGPLLGSVILIKSELRDESPECFYEIQEALRNLKGFDRLVPAKGYYYSE